MLVYVIDGTGKPLMPCKPRVAKLLLKQGKAACKRRSPFTIKLKYCFLNPEVQDLTIGIDLGTKTIGSAVRDNQNQVYYLSQVEVRDDIKNKMDQRRMYRRTRRGRKTRYRECRFLNRRNSIKDNRYSPTLRSKYRSFEKEIEFISSLLPVTKLIVETGNFDMHAMQNSEVLYHPWMYQKGIQVGYYNTKAFVLDRDQHTCRNCNTKSKDQKLNVHHVIHRSKGGSDLPSNLITLCEDCHHKVHVNTITLNIKKIKSKLLKHASQMNVLSMMIRTRNVITEALGSVTKAVREYFNIPKTHCYDAFCLNLETDIRPTLLTDKVILKRCTSKGDYQLTKGKRSEKKMPNKKICGFKRYDKILYDGVTSFIKGRMSTGYAFLEDIFGEAFAFKPIPKLKLMERITARNTWKLQEVDVISF